MKKVGDDVRVSIDPSRLWRRHEDMARLGATARGGVNRAALTPADIEVHLRLAEWARNRDLVVEIDAYGNQFMRRPGSDPGLAPLTSGSHSDTQPSGGRFDGIYGVLAAVEALEAIDDTGIPTRHPIEAVIWNNEEGVRFDPTAFGSAVYVGEVPISAMLEARDSEGTTIAMAVDRLRGEIPWAAARTLGAPIAAFIEAHIEQGPELEAEGLTIGIVTGIQGTRKFVVEIVGEEAHAGTTSVHVRSDAFVDAVRAVNALHAIFHDDNVAEAARFTIGRFEVHPGAMAVVPGKVTFGIDFRHPRSDELERLGNLIAEACVGAVRRCDVRVRETRRASPTAFEGAVPRAIEQAVRERGYGFKHMPSGAGHDARCLAGFCPSGMIFVPCEKGISHNEKENADPRDLAAGAQVLADTLLILDAF